MKMNWAKSSWALLALCFSVSAAAQGREDYLYGPNWANHGAGTYVAELDLNPLGIPRIEAMALILHRDGTVNFVSEHEPADLSSSGVGVWKQLSRKKIGIGILMYRMSEVGPPTVCGNIMVSNPDNCVLKLGTQVRRDGRGAYTGTMLLTIDGPKSPDGDTVSVTVPVDLPFTMRRVKLAEFPGAR